MTKIKFVLGLLFVFLIFSVVHAEEAPTKASSTKKKERRVKLTFGDELVKGSVEKPDVSSFNSRTDFNYKKLIRVRDNFVNEMEGGIDDFKGN